MKDEQTGLPEFTILELKDPTKYWIAHIKDRDDNHYYLEVPKDVEKKSSQILKYGEIIALRLGNDAVRNIARQRIRNPEELEDAQNVELDQTYGQFCSMIKRKGVAVARKFIREKQKPLSHQLPIPAEALSMVAKKEEPIGAKEVGTMTKAFHDRFPSEYNKKQVFWDGTVAFVKKTYICRCGNNVIVHAKLTINAEKNDFLRQNNYFSPDKSAEFVDGVWTHVTCKDKPLPGKKEEPRPTTKEKQKTEAPPPEEKPFDAVAYLEEITAKDSDHTGDEVVKVLRCLLRARLIKSVN